MSTNPRLTRIDGTTIGDHSHLVPEDECYFVHEYTPGKGYSFSATNNLISNLKKSPSKAGRPEYKWKIAAMNDCSEKLGGAINQKWLNYTTLVPIPPSKIIGHPEYDDRIEQICRNIPGDAKLDVRNIVKQLASKEASHISDDRPTPNELFNNYTIDESECQNAVASIGIIDDVLTAGSHYRAVSKILAGRFPGIPIVGIFIARRVLEKEEMSWFEAL